MDEYQAEITSITLRRGPCFGTCPMYEVTLAADGAATWYGERFVDRLGRYQGQVDVNDFGRLARFMQRAGFLDWEPEYLGNVTDLPDYFLTAVVGDQTKTVRQNGVDEPPDFWVIAAVVDGLAEAINWTAVPSMEGTCHDWAAFHDHMPPGPVGSAGAGHLPVRHRRVLRGAAAPRAAGDQPARPAARPHRHPTGRSGRPGRDGGRCPLLRGDGV
jgi:Domain of unknown function (DUF6438)